MTRIVTPGAGGGAAGRGISRGANRGQPANSKGGNWWQSPFCGAGLRYPVPMQPIQPDQASFLLHGVYLPGLKNEHRITKSVIEAIPPDKGDYRPDGISKSALDLAWHIVATEMRFMDALQAGAFDFSPRPRPDAIKNSQDLNGWYTENFAPRFEKLTKLSH